jgi:uncharacterized protein YciI
MASGPAGWSRSRLRDGADVRFRLGISPDSPCRARAGPAALTDSPSAVYFVPLVPPGRETKLHINALEKRLAELESHLASLGQIGINKDQLGLGSVPAKLQHLPAPVTGAQPFLRLEQTESADEDNEIFVAVQTLALAASGHYDGASSSSITVGRVLSSLLQHASSQQCKGIADEGNHTPESEIVIGVPFLSYPVAQRLLQGWFVHVGLHYPTLLTPRLLRLNGHRETLNDVYERSILQLVYAVSGRWLESVGERRWQLLYSALEDSLRHWLAVCRTSS